MVQSEKILFLLGYDVSKTLSENKKSFINEQISDTKFGLERFGYNPNKPETLDTAAKKEREFNKNIVNLIPPESRHDVLMWTSFVANFFGPFGFAASIGLDTLNAYLYHKEGRDFEAGLQLFFSIIPGMELLGLPVVKKYGVKFFEELLKKSTWSGKMTQEEIRALRELLSKDTVKQLRKLTMKFLFKFALKSLIKSFSFYDLVRFMWLLGKKYPKSVFLTRMVLSYKGITYTWEKLAEKLGITKEVPVDKDSKKNLELEFEKNKTNILEITTNDILTYYQSLDDSTADSLFNDIFESIPKNNKK